MAVVSFLARPKPRIPFLGLSLLRNQTETLATQAKISLNEQYYVLNQEKRNDHTDEKIIEQKKVYAWAKSNYINITGLQSRKVIKNYLVFQFFFSKPMKLEAIKRQALQNKFKWWWKLNSLDI